MSSTFKMEFDAYSSILNNLRSLAQEARTKDPGQFQVTDTIRAHLQEMLDSLMSGQDETQFGWA